MDCLGYNHWSFSSVRQVSGPVLRWDGLIEDFYQEECYHVPEVVQWEFQEAQGQIAWVASRGQETSDHVAAVEWELKHLWVMVWLEQKYLHHLIKGHLVPLQCACSSTTCQCSIVGNFGQSPILESF